MKKDSEGSPTMFWLSLDGFLTRLRPHRETLSLLLDGTVVAIAWQATYLFRLGFERWFSARPGYDAAVMASLVALYMAVLWAFRVPKGMWRFSGFGEVKRLGAACVVAGSVGAASVLLAQLTAVPRAVLALHPVFCIIALGMMRLGYRMLYEHMRGRITGGAPESQRVLILGAGRAGRLLAAGMQHQGWVVVGWLDDDVAKSDTRIAGIPVLGTLADVQHNASLHGITHLVVAMPSADHGKRRRALDLAGSTGLHVLTVPSSDELLSGSKVEQVRDIEPEDLLGREPVQLDEAGINECLQGKVVLITGAGGSIGGELCRQIARYGPARIVLYEVSEYALYAIEQELSERFPALALVPLIGDVKDGGLLRACFARFRPEVIFHAAAYKHVPLVERENAWAAMRNNTLGTYRVARAAAEAGVGRFVLISTDKAVNPTNIMGATKRAAELVISHMASLGGATRFMAVRFGNVLGSSGSVIPRFKAQIAKGGPVTVTHPDITRYFMTIPEATKLVLQAAALGESGQVFLLDMGEPIKIADLARDMIRMSGHKLDQISITFVGLRPGEKLYEELLLDSDTTLPTRIKRLHIAALRGPDTRFAAALDALDAERRPMTETQVRTLLHDWVPEFKDAPA